MEMGFFYLFTLIKNGRDINDSLKAIQYLRLHIS